ncbi:penicillin-binding protein [Cellulomonas sp. NPDC089187]|uniref:penicillin-binding protein n=1 Tax=Cellulomonas sp. NPDC089187 TaxID=3154970 RepID=UPI003419AA3A
MPSPSPSRSRQMTAGQAVALFMAFLLASGIGGLLAAGLALPTVAMANSATDLGVQAFEDLPSELEQKPLSEKSVVLAADGTQLAEFWAENREVVTQDRISEQMQNAVIATEDRRFYQHGGIDPTGTLRAAVANFSGGSTQGGSTLTQQYVKNVLIESAIREGDFAAAEAAREADGTEGYARKLREAKLAIALEKTMTKDEILTAYLNIAQFGISTYGVEAAAQRYFSKPAAELNYLEAATIAGITNSPTLYDPVKNPDKSEGRRNTVLFLMHDQGYITDEEYEAGKATPLGDTLHISEPKSGCIAAEAVVAGAGYFCDYVTNVIKNDPAFGETKEERQDLLLRGGLTITTTLDIRVQTAANDAVKGSVPVNDPSGVGQAMSVVEPGTGQIKAMAQNRDFNNAETVEAGQTAVNYNTSYEYGGSTGFPPGSTFKAFTLLQWLKDGHALTETVNGAVRTLNTNQFTACGSRLGNSTYKAGNAEGNGGMMSVLNATQNSVNLAYLSMAMQLDLCDIMNGAAELGVVQAGNGEPFQAFPANVLGSDSTTPLAMAGAYATFASGGVYCSPIAITAVQDASGADLPVPTAGCKQAISPEVANAMAYAMGNVWSGTGKGIGTPAYEAAGKTGTTSHNEHTWFAGYTPRLATAVWVGHPDSMTPMQRVTINGRYYPSVYGATIAGKTWKAAMDSVLLDGSPNPAFGEANTNEIYGAPVAVPSVIGLDVDTAQQQLVAAGFGVQTGEPQYSELPVNTVLDQSPSGSATPGSMITVILSQGPDPAAQQPADPANPNPAEANRPNQGPGNGNNG